MEQVSFLLLEFNKLAVKVSGLKPALWNNLPEFAGLAQLNILWTCQEPCGLVAFSSSLYLENLDSNPPLPHVKNRRSCEDTSNTTSYNIWKWSI